MNSQDYFSKIDNASEALKGIVNFTPCLRSRTLDKMTGCEVILKCENFQRTGSFKFRGAYNAVRQLNQKEKDAGIITHSSGNHAQALALVGALHKIKTTVVMPEDAPQVKIDAVKGYGAKIVFSDSPQISREETCQKLIDTKGYTFIHPARRAEVIQGAGTACKELLETNGKCDYILAPVGSGGLLSGTAIYAKISKKVKKVIGCEPAAADDAYLSFTTNKLHPQNNPNTIADGLRTGLSKMTLSIIKSNVDEIVTVDEKEIKDAMYFIWCRMKILIEPSSAVPVAVLKKMTSNGLIPKGSKIGMIISGGNVDPSYFIKK